MLSATMLILKIVDVENIEDGWMVLDIGPKTRELYVEALAPMKTHYLEWSLWAYLKWKTLQLVQMQ